MVVWAGVFEFRLCLVGPNQPESRTSGELAGVAALPAGSYLRSPHGMALQAEALELSVPSGNDKTLFVWNLQPCRSEEETYDCVFNTFSEFGVLYSVRVCKNASVAEPGYYAVVKFFSAVDANRAQGATNGKALFQQSPVKVRMCTKQNEKRFWHQAWPLNSTKCQELANYYLGFNGWTKRIALLQNISGTEELENEEAKPLLLQSLKYLCVVEINFTNHGVCSRGVGVVEEELENDKDPSEYIMKLRKVQKFAVQKAVSDAFQKVLLVILGNGKVAIEYRADKEEAVDSLTVEELKGLIQVNDLSWTETQQQGEEELLSDISFDANQLEGME